MKEIIKDIGFLLLLIIGGALYYFPENFKWLLGNQHQKTEISNSAALDSDEAAVADPCVTIPVAELPKAAQQETENSDEVSGENFDNRDFDDMDFDDEPAQKQEQKQKQEPASNTEIIPYYYPFPTNQSAPQTQRSTPRMCTICCGTGNCQNCYGSGSYNNPYTGDRMPCSVCGSRGKCWHCNGSGTEP